MLKNISTRLNFSVDIFKLRAYYQTVKTSYDHLNWSWSKCSGTIIDQWRDAAYKDPANLLTHGWAIQSNLKDISLPCPPWNISTLETVEYRNTDLVFDIIHDLQKAVPYAYRWSVSVQPPGGKVSLHSDNENEYTVWIPIYTGNEPVITFIVNDQKHDINLKDDGSAYLLDTTIPHYTFNSTDKDRVTVIFRLDQKHVKDILNLNEI
jgi:hypothetical protein